MSAARPPPICPVRARGYRQGERGRGREGKGEGEGGREKGRGREGGREGGRLAVGPSGAEFEGREEEGVLVLPLSLLRCNAPHTHTLSQHSTPSHHLSSSHM
eukprot:1553338-Rhodomonas_salina.1